MNARAAFISSSLETSSVFDPPIYTPAPIAAAL